MTGHGIGATSRGTKWMGGPADQYVRGRSAAQPGRRRLSTAAPGFAIVQGSLNLKFAHGESEELMSATGFGAQRDSYWS